MGKFIVYTILSTVVIFFVWNILKRIFFNKFYNYFPHQKQRHENGKKETFSSNNKRKNYNWEAETIDYEEVSEGNNRR